MPQTGEQDWESTISASGTTKNKGMLKKYLRLNNHPTATAPNGEERGRRMTRLQQPTDFKAQKPAQHLSLLYICFNIYYIDKNSKINNIFFLTENCNDTIE